MISSINNSDSRLSRPKVSFKADLEISEAAKNILLDELGNVRLKDTTQQQEVSGKHFDFERFLENLQSTFRRVTKDISGVVRITGNPLLNSCTLQYDCEGHKYDAGSCLSSNSIDFSDISVAELIPPSLEVNKSLEDNPFVNSIIHRCNMMDCEAFDDSFTGGNPFARLSFDFYIKRMQAKGDDAAAALVQDFKDRFGHPKD